jgi:hypothetical protein
MVAPTSLKNCFSSSAKNEAGFAARFALLYKIRFYNIYLPPMELYQKSLFQKKISICHCEERRMSDEVENAPWRAIS